MSPIALENDAHKTIAQRVYERLMLVIIDGEIAVASGKANVISRND